MTDNEILEQLEAEEKNIETLKSEDIKDKIVFDAVFCTAFIVSFYLAVALIVYLINELGTFTTIIGGIAGSIVINAILAGIRLHRNKISDTESNTDE